MVRLHLVLMGAYLKMDKEKTDEVLRHMQEAADAPPPSIEESIRHAEELGVYSHEEAELYINAYRNCFHRERELYPED